jgi:hypothetical protein
MTNDKMIPASISVDWWYGETELEGVAEFKAELSDNYILSTVRDRRGPLGGGLYQLAVEFVSRLSLSEIVRILLEGATYDLLKSGTDAFFIRPFLEAYKRFRSRRKNERVGIDRIRFVLQDSAITIERLPHTDLLAELESILRAVAENWVSIIEGSSDRIFDIYIAIFEDTTDERVSFCKYRTLLTTDETIDVSHISRADYFKLWGLQYYSDVSPSRVYDVQRRSIIAQSFCTESMYWSAKMYSTKKESSSA